MKLSDFDYSLPKESIAAFPPADRPSARLLHIESNTGHFSHHTFRDLPDFLVPGDVLVLNNTKVLPARLFGCKETGGRVEALLLKKKASGIENSWEALIRPNRRVKKNSQIVFGKNGMSFEAEVLDEARPESGKRLLRFKGDSVLEKMEKFGHMPLPPYLDRPDTEMDRELYQTVFAQKPGAVASPTAGLHFDEMLLDALRRKGIETVFVTLHVSYGTFRSIAAENPAEHRMEEEEFEVTEDASRKINRALDEKRRVIACGTTSVRTLESSVDPETGRVRHQTGNTSLFIYPSYPFKIVQGLITNFHLPKSTLLLLVAAFLDDKGTGRDMLFRAYNEAIRQGYRFYSYGDAMVIL
ncbi:MAG TPA: tRNA preQ1(34) S-adenosylmethionine ribosyltransferase-isomerase QueA [bacterium]|nr:tRNA preQ1(34) S-adenosylmethionine ribosyltransferase-isomerase QueA [bacterium]